MQHSIVHHRNPNTRETYKMTSSEQSLRSRRRVRTCSRPACCRCLASGRRDRLSGAQAQCPRVKMAARCSPRWLLVAVGIPRLPAAAGRGAQQPRGGVVATSLARKLSISASGLPMSGHGPRALLTLRPGVRLTGERGFQISSSGSWD